jgi:hypothetical protein
MCAHTPGTDTVKSIVTRSVAVDLSALDTFSANIPMNTDIYGANLRYKFSWGGSRGITPATWAKDERLNVPILDGPLEFRDQLVMQSGSVLQITVRNAASIAPSTTRIKAKRVTLTGTLQVILENFTPTATQLATQAFTIIVPNAFAVERPSESTFAFASFVSTTVTGFKPSTAVVTAAGQLELTFVTGTPPTTTLAPNTPPTTAPITSTTTTVATTAAAGGSTGSATTGGTQTDDGLTLFGLSGVVLYAAMGGAGLGALLLIVCIVVIAVVLCRRRGSRNSHSFDNGAMIHMQTQSRHSSVSNFSAPPTLKPPPTLGTQDYVTTPSALPPILALDARTTSYAQPKTVVGGSDIAY